MGYCEWTIDAIDATLCLVRLCIVVFFLFHVELCIVHVKTKQKKQTNKEPLRHGELYVKVVFIFLFIC